MSNSLPEMSNREKIGKLSGKVFTRGYILYNNLIEFVLCRRHIKNMNEPCKYFLHRYNSIFLYLLLLKSSRTKLVIYVIRLEKLMTGCFYS